MCLFRPRHGVMRRLFVLAVLLIGSSGLAPMRAAAPSFVDITWMSISNLYYQLGDLKVITDGYFTRLPENEFFGGGGGLANTRICLLYTSPSPRDS